MPSHGIIEVIALAPSLKPFFTGDNGAPFVAVQPSPADPEDCHFSRNGILFAPECFQNGDAVLILGGGFRLPYVYSMATLPLIIDLTWISSGEEFSQVPAGQLIFPNEGQEIEFKGSSVDGIFIPSGGLTYPDLVTSWFLCGTLAAANIGTVNQFYAPDDFNGEDLEIDVWLKIQHTLPLVVAP